MSVLGYLDARATGAILSSTEQSSISTSIAALSGRLSTQFGASLVQQLRFGSSTRGTILPRSMDEHSDIDYMIVFKEDGSTPQTYLDRVKRFAEKYYFSSEIKQSSPSIVLELHHIKFDLVPALRTILGYKVVESSWGWRDTNPNDFNNKLTAKNNAELYKIKPTIRLMKLWNAKNGYVYDSYLLEKWIVDLSFWGCINQTQYLFNTFDQLNPSADLTQWRRERIERAKALVAKTREYEQEGYPALAQAEVEKLIPP